MNKKMEKAWLIYWEHQGGKDLLLERYGIKNPFIDILSLHKSKSQLQEFIQEYYIRNMLTLEERFPFKHYTKGNKNKDYFLKNKVRESSYYQNPLYIESIKEDDEEKLKEWKNKIAPYFTIGHNPFVVARKVYNLSLESEKEGGLILKYDDKRSDGSYESKMIHID